MPTKRATSLLGLLLSIVLLAPAAPANAESDETAIELTPVGRPPIKPGQRVFVTARLRQTTGRCTVWLGLPDGRAGEFGVPGALEQSIQGEIAPDRGGGICTVMFRVPWDAPAGQARLALVARSGDETVSVPSTLEIAADPEMNVPVEVRVGQTRAAAPGEQMTVPVLTNKTLRGFCGAEVAFAGEDPEDRDFDVGPIEVDPLGRCDLTFTIPADVRPGLARVEVIVGAPITIQGVADVYVEVLPRR